MSASLDHPQNSDSTSPATADEGGDVLARLADVHKELAGALARAGIFIESRPVPALPAERSESDAALQRMRPACLPARGVAPPARLPLHKRPRFRMLVRLAMANVTAAAIVLLALGKIALPPNWREAAKSTIDVTGSSPASATPTTPTARPKPWLLARDARGTRSEPVPLDVAVQGRADGGVIVVTGLIPGMTLSMGEAIGDDAWRIAASDVILGDLWVIPPEDFVGTVDLVAELRLADLSVAHRRPIQLEWTPAAPAKAPVETRDAAITHPVPPSLEREAIVVLVEHGKDLFAAGDLVAARLVLERAAQASDAEAALALAATYDPVILKELNVQGLAADAALARRWYEKAKELGSAEAPRRLELLASVTN